MNELQVNVSMLKTLLAHQHSYVVEARNLDPLKISTAYKDAGLLLENSEWDGYPTNCLLAVLLTVGHLDVLDKVIEALPDETQRIFHLVSSEIEQNNHLTLPKTGDYSSVWSDVYRQLEKEACGYPVYSQHRQKRTTVKLIWRYYDHLTRARGRAFTDHRCGMRRMAFELTSLFDQALTMYDRIKVDDVAERDSVDRMFCRIFVASL